jgi:hypothetical protein
VLGWRQEGWVVGQIFKMGEDEQPFGYGQKKIWPAHGQVLRKNKTGLPRLQATRPSLQDPWLSVPASQRVWLYLYSELYEIFLNRAIKFVAFNNFPGLVKGKTSQLA